MKFQKISSSLVIGVIALSSLSLSITPASASPVNVTAGIENVVHDSNQQQIIDVFNGINTFRASKGLPPVMFNVPLSGISQKWSEEMAATDYFRHNPNYTGGAPAGYTNASEIIAARNDRIGQELVNQWINSPGHNAVMSDARYTTMGIGVAFTDKTTPQDLSATRYGMYGTANLFRYTTIPEGTYASPADYFAGKPPIKPPASNIFVTPVTPFVYYTTKTYTIPQSIGVDYYVNGIKTASGNYPGQGTVTITAIPKSGYSLLGATFWEFTFSEPTTPTPTPTPTPAFTDLGSTGFATEVTWMKTSGISTGYPDGTYRPHETVTREAMAAFLYRMAGKPAYTPPSVSPFVDVPTNHLFYKEITWMHASKISTGWADKTYRPYENVTREAMSAFIKRFSGDYCSVLSAETFVAPSTATFTDSRTSVFYKEIEWMRTASISTGYPDRSYRPFDNVTREAMAAFLYRTDVLVKSNGGCKP